MCVLSFSKEDTARTDHLQLRGVSEYIAITPAITSMTSHKVFGWHAFFRAITPSSGSTEHPARLQADTNNGSHQPILCQGASPIGSYCLQSCPGAHPTVSMEAPGIAAAKTLDSGCLTNLWRLGVRRDRKNEHNARPACFANAKQRFANAKQQMQNKNSQEFNAESAVARG